MAGKGGWVPGSVAMERPDMTWMHSQSPLVGKVRDCCAPTESLWTTPVW